MTADTITLIQKTEKYQEYSLPYGWKKVGKRRKKGTNSKHWDFHLIYPNGKQFRSTIEVNKYLDSNPMIDCDRNVTNTSILKFNYK